MAKNGTQRYEGLGGHRDDTARGSHISAVKMEILITIGLISAIASLVWMMNRILPFRICPVCVGVSLTWLLVLAGLNLGLLAADGWLLIAAIAMGGTVVGIAYQGEKRFNWAAGNAMKFKLFVVLIGFLLVYLALNLVSWVVFWAEISILGVVAYLYFIMPREIEQKVKDPANIQEIEEKLKNCC